MVDRFGNGCVFTENERGQKIDEEGFATSSVTYITNRRTCVSVKIENKDVKVRNTEDPTKKTLSFNHQEWTAFIEGAKNGEFDF
ncbi:MAG: hypothetical protein COV09_01415 [Candidatus Vogelbacteria bacterium CG10_big_fil_rev_8_21_14_0_10_50_13]|uniref:DUF397 domain-containing protein n=1 Tax=Candidatus Vogelbacteria bacterium CG10_big_fil_rev_8_21_14_0_10_50_13 TaxID=1975044 RepID=A0A2H0RG51_9BACT|nr:MAG: hypothetical protein COV09_01415 [Candidatus Vogelbacteria bacterium CG10_big_fil_rev_8_21_14_0_10_50_13]